MIRHKYVPAVCRICGSDPVHDAQWVKCTNPLCNLSQHKTHVVSWPRKAVIDWRATVADMPADLSRTVVALKARADRWYTRNEMKLLYWTREALGGLLFVLCLAVWILALMLAGCSMPADVAETEKQYSMFCMDVRDNSTFTVPLKTASVMVGIGSESVITGPDTNGITRVMKDSYSAWLKCEKVLANVSR